MSGDCLYPSGGPPLNTDVGGIGVRLSFYLQTIFLGWLAARSESTSEISGALYTLIATNVATVATSFILALKGPAMSFHDALVVLYLVYLSWVTVVFSLPALNHFPGSSRTLRVLSIIQTYFAFGFALYLVGTAPTFGNSQGCNTNAVLVLFRPFPVLNTGRIVAGVLTSLVITIYTAMTVKDYTPARVKNFVKRMVRRRRVRHHDRAPKIDPEVPGDDSVHDEPPIHHIPNFIPVEPLQTLHVAPVYESPTAYGMIIELAVTTILWALAVMNTELLIVWNGIQPPNEWQYGQILPLCLVVVPLTSVIDVFQRYRFKKSSVFENDCQECKLKSQRSNVEKAV